MDKIIKHLKNNAAIYLVLIACLVIIGISLFVTHDGEKEKIKTVDTSLFTVVNLDDAIELFKKEEPSLLVIGHKTCGATIGYVPYLQIAEARFGYVTYYLELADIDKSEKEKYDKLVELLDMEYKFQGDIDSFGKFLGNTPMTIIIKNKKMVYGYLGSMNDTTLGTLTKAYGVATKEG